MKKLFAILAICSGLLSPAVRADTGLAMRCDGVSVATQAAACTGSRTWMHPTAGDTGAYLSYPTVPANSTTIAWNDANLQFRPWVSISGTAGVLTCTKDLTAPSVIPVGGPDQCAPGNDAVAKVFVAASTVQLTTMAPPVVTTPPPVASSTVDTVGLTWIAPTTNTDGSPLTDLAGFNIYQGISATTLSKVGTVALSANSYTTASLTPGTYYFAVTAVNSAGTESAQTAPVSHVLAPPPPKVPGAPTNLKITVTVSTGP